MGRAFAQRASSRRVDDLHTGKKGGNCGATAEFERGKMPLAQETGPVSHHVDDHARVRVPPIIYRPASFLHIQALTEVMCH